MILDLIFLAAFMACNNRSRPDKGRVKLEFTVWAGQLVHDRGQRLHSISNGRLGTMPVKAAPIYNDSLESTISILQVISLISHRATNRVTNAALYSL